MRPLRILSVADVPEDPNAGAAGAEFQTIRALRTLGHEVDDVWSIDLGRRIQHGNLHYLLELPRAYERAVRERLSRKPYDIVHVNQPHGFRAARLVQRRWPSTVFIHRSHGFEPRVEKIVAAWKRAYGEDERAPWRRGATSVLASLLHRHTRQITRWADGHLLCSSEDAAFMRDEYGVSATRIAVVPHAAPDLYLERTVRPMTPERLRHVLYVGQFAFVKAPGIVAQAINEIAALDSGVRFTWVASRSHHDSIRALLSPVARPRTALLDWMPQAALLDVYDKAGVFLFPSFFEGTGKASIEAMSRGLCVIASAVGGMRDMIQDGVNGFLVPPGSAASVTESAIRLLNDPDLAARIAGAAATHSRLFTWTRTARETADFYRERMAQKLRR